MIDWLCNVFILLAYRNDFLYWVYSDYDNDLSFVFKKVLKDSVIEFGTSDILWNAYNYDETINVLEISGTSEVLFSMNLIK